MSVVGVMTADTRNAPTITHFQGFSSMRGVTSPIRAIKVSSTGS